jgi:hypothetical protein
MEDLLEDDELDYDEDDEDLVVTVSAPRHSALAIIANYQAHLAHRDALREVNATTMTITAGDPPPNARELTLEEVAHGVFADGPWQWPIPVHASFAGTYDLTDRLDLDAVNSLALVMRCMASLYHQGYRLTGPPIITGVPGLPSDPEAARYLTRQGLDPADTDPPMRPGGRLSHAQIRCIQALRDKWHDIKLADARDLVLRLAENATR